MSETHSKKPKTKKVKKASDPIKPQDEEEQQDIVVAPPKMDIQMDDQHVEPEQHLERKKIKMENGSSDVHHIQAPPVHDYSSPQQLKLYQAIGHDAVLPFIPDISFVVAANEEEAILELNQKLEFHQLKTYSEKPFDLVEVDLRRQRAYMYVHS